MIWGSKYEKLYKAAEKKQGVYDSDLHKNIYHRDTALSMAGEELW